MQLKDKIPLLMLKNFSNTNLQHQLAVIITKNFNLALHHTALIVYIKPTGNDVWALHRKTLALVDV